MLHAEQSPGTDFVAIRTEVPVPALIDGEKKLYEIRQLIAIRQAKSVRRASPFHRQAFNLLLCYVFPLIARFGQIAMHRLYTYLCALNMLPSPVKTVNKTEILERFSEGENMIEERESFYLFNNGVQVLYRVESDTFQADDVCRECWISYEVMRNGGYDISPQKKQFYNRCQESFWLKMQAETE